MEKKLFLVAFIPLSALFNAQVGINTENPQRLFHLDGKSSTSTTNPPIGLPSVAQQIDDVVITNEGRMGIGTISPSEKLEVNGKTKIKDLPVNGSEGFAGTKTLVADNNGVIGVLNGLPQGVYDGYNLTQMKGFSSDNATTRSYPYNQLVHTQISSWIYSPNPNLVVLPSYSMTFDRLSNASEKYIFLSFDYQGSSPTVGGYTANKAFYTNYDLEILVNGIKRKTHSATYNINALANPIYDGNKIFTIDLVNVPLNPTGNSLEIKIVPTANIFSYNAGTSGGSLATGSATVLSTSIKDISFFLYEK